MSHAQPPSPFVGKYPIEPVGSEENLFTPVCLRTHWDPTEMIRRILPQQQVALPQDFRPLVRVCKSYRTSAPAEMAPLPPTNMVFPTGGQFYPPGRYSSHIDTESDLRTLSYPIDKWCSTTQYIPRMDSTMYREGSTVPDHHPLSNAFVSELAMPQALLRTDETTCRSENDSLYFQRSGRLFNNPTKQDRYGADTYYSLPERDHGRGGPMPHGGVPMPTPTEGAAQSRWSIPQPGATKSPAQGNINGRSQKRGPVASLKHSAAGTSAVGVTTSGLAAPVW